MTEKKICPFMSRPVLQNPAAGIYLAEVECLRERCAAWNPKYPDCRLIWGP